MLEKALESNLRNQVEKLGGECWKFVSPGRRGVPDRIVILPGGFSCFVEVKKPGKSLEPLQLEIHKKIQRLKFPVYVVDNSESLIIFIQILKSKL